jgi:hypothetical protein
MPFAGVAWQVLSYLEGLRRLGHEVFYLEDTQRWPYDPVNETVCDDARPAIDYVGTLMRRHGFDWAYRDVASGELHGASEARLDRALSRADVLINLSGVTILRDQHLDVPVRVYLETDPVLPQIEVAQGRTFTIEFLDAHTHHFSYGENFGAHDCRVPIGRYQYQPTRPPVILDWWDTSPGSPEPTMKFTTIANWHQTSKDITWEGQTLTWSKDVQFNRFLELPRRVPVPIELALAAQEGQALVRLRDAGWLVRPAGPLSKDVDAYREFIRQSAGEFSVAKEQNIAMRSGWFSDRTASYLAAGKPAIVQDTGFGCTLPTGEGLLAFRDADEAQEAFESVLSDYRRHCRAARSIAEQYLSSEVVLAELIRSLQRSKARA